MSKKVEVRSRLETNIDFRYSNEEKLKWQKLMSKCIQEEESMLKNIIYFTGGKKSGKSTLMKKIINYLTQRDRI